MFEHIVRTKDGQYRIRKPSFLGWAYYSQSEDCWYVFYTGFASRFDTQDEAHRAWGGRRELRRQRMAATNSGRDAWVGWA